MHAFQSMFPFFLRADPPKSDLNSTNDGGKEIGEIVVSGFRFYKLCLDEEHREEWLQEYRVSGYKSLT
jgi:hypothetical protein